MTDSPEFAPAPAIVPEAAAEIPVITAPPPRLWPGVLAWTIVCAGYLVVERLDLVDGLDLPVPLIAALVVARLVDQRPRVRRFARFAAVVLVVAGVALSLFALWSRRHMPLLDHSTIAGVVTVTIALAMLLVPGVRRAILGRIGLEPGSAVHLVVVVAIAVTLATSAILFVELQSAPDETVPFHLSDSLVSLLSDGALTLAGIGFLLTRGVRASITRLDLRPIRMRQIALALGIAAAFLLLVGVMERVEHAWLPALYAREDRFDYEFIGVSPLVGAVLLSVAAGIGEELVFRGALQPRVGVVLTAVTFAAVHVQYQVPGLVMILVVGLGLGIIKKYRSTTFTVCVHVFYDIGAFLIP